MATSKIKYSKQNYLFTGYQASGNCNDFEAWSAYHCSSNVSNLPVSGSWAMVLTFYTYGDFNRMQLALTVGNSKKLYTRYLDSGKWTSWIAVGGGNS